MQARRCRPQLRVNRRFVHLHRKQCHVWVIRQACCLDTHNEAMSHIDGRLTYTFDRACMQEIAMPMPLMLRK